jgi:hypothetical protein
MATIKLSENFLDELIKLMTLKKSVLSICVKHFKYSYVYKEYEEYKLIIQSIINQFNNSGKLPSLGVTSQQYITNAKVQAAISKIRETPIVDEELIISQLEVFIKRIEFQNLNEQIFNLYSKDNKQEEAIELSAKESIRINQITLRTDETKMLGVFRDFHKENKLRQEAKEDYSKTKLKIPFGIDIIDMISGGGMEGGEIAMWIFMSGVGKSTALKWSGMHCALLGYDVLHFQLEDSKEKARDKYTQIFANIDFKSIRSGNITPEVLAKIDKLINQVVQRGNDIDIYNFEQMGQPTMVDIREVTFDYFNRNGKFPHLIIIDSLDLCATGENKKIDTDPDYKKEKFKRVAQMMKNLALELPDTRIITSMQTGDIPPSIWNDPDKFISRSNTEGDRTLVQPFDFVFSGNRTMEEEKKEIARIYFDKVRYSKLSKRMYPICTNYDKGAFYSSKKTRDKFDYSDNV